MRGLGAPEHWYRQKCIFLFCYKTVSFNVIKDIIAFIFIISFALR